MNNSSVLDSRWRDTMCVTHRRYQCHTCNERFSTREFVILEVQERKDGRYTLEEVNSMLLDQKKQIVSMIRKNIKSLLGLDEKV